MKLFTCSKRAGLLSHHQDTSSSRIEHVPTIEALSVVCVLVACPTIRMLLDPIDDCSTSDCGKKDRASAFVTEKAIASCSSAAAAAWKRTGLLVPLSKLTEDQRGWSAHWLSRHVSRRPAGLASRPTRFNVCSPPDRSNRIEKASQSGPLFHRQLGEYCLQCLYSSRTSLRSVIRPTDALPPKSLSEYVKLTSPSTRRITPKIAGTMMVQKIRHVLADLAGSCRGLVRGAVGRLCSWRRGQRRPIGASGAGAGGSGKRVHLIGF